MKRGEKKEFFEKYREVFSGQGPVTPEWMKPAREPTPGAEGQDRAASSRVHLAGPAEPAFAVSAKTLVVVALVAAAVIVAAFLLGGLVLGGPRQIGGPHGPRDEDETAALMRLERIEPAAEERTARPPVYGVRVHSYERPEELWLAGEVCRYLESELVGHEACVRESGRWCVVYVGRFSSSRHPEATALLKRVQGMRYRRRKWEDAYIEEIPE